MFKTLPVVEAICRAEGVPSAARAYRHDTITLGWRDRIRTRGRRRSDGGVEFGTALPRGTILAAGDCFVIDAARTLVEVVEQLEPALVVEPASTAEWALFAYHIGNGHQPLMITERGLVCPDDPGAEMLLQYHRIPYLRARLAFTPSGAVPDHQHSFARS